LFGSDLSCLTVNIREQEELSIDLLLMIFRAPLHSAVRYFTLPFLNL
jgi:hypothetical protein